MSAAAPLMIVIFGPGFEADRHNLAAELLRYTAFYLLFISLVALAGSIQNSFQRFAAPAFTPVLLNLSLIACALTLPEHLDVPVMALAIGTLVAGIVQLLFQVPFLIKLGMLPLPRFNLQHPGMRKVLKLMVPAMLSSSVTQISLVLDTIIASFLIAGSVSWLYYSDRVMELPLGVFSIAIATVLLPSLSKKFAEQDDVGFSQQIDWGMRLSTLITIPAAIGLVLLAGPILVTLVQYGKFDAFDSTMARYSLVAYAIGLPAFGYTKILQPGFFARHDTRTPLKITYITILIKLLLTAALVIPLYLKEIPWAHAGLALATSLTAWTQTFLFYFYLRRQKAYVPNPGWRRLMLQIVLAVVIMSITLIYAVPGFEHWTLYSMWQRAVTLGAIIIPAALMFFAVLWLSGFRLAQFRGNHF
jgi:putative peptidoglycan lipid II flippase